MIAHSYCMDFSPEVLLAYEWRRTIVRLYDLQYFRRDAQSCVSTFYNIFVETHDCASPISFQYLLRQ